jgi:hypothetical protein
MDELDLGPSYAKIGEIAYGLAQPLSGTMLVYMEIEEGMIGASVFIDAGANVRWVGPADDLTDHIYDMWLSIDPDKRWATMTYVLRDGKFTATFRFPDEVDVEDFDDERIEDALRQVFGDKQVAYPQPEDDVQTWLFEGGNANGTTQE